ncbi:glycerol-3-phosphate dehydrogenase [Gammaproteobacteria bacterium SCGC AG-212-F23]|nr:glycerol-3-phosphate dehydrogenase [Gammaproteobacteria bacterium SCGC AG-212-F23]
MNPILVLGAGAWGTALALHLAHQGQTVRLWSIETDHITQMINERINTRYLPGFPFPDNLIPMPDLQKALQGVDDFLVAVPSAGFRDTLEALKPSLTARSGILWASKGLDMKTGQLLHQVVEEVLQDQFPYAVLSGPSFAAEVAKGLPTAVVIASHQKKFAEAMSKRFNSPAFRVYLSNDIVGVEIGGAIKNVLAIATGISDGMGFGANARCALIARGLAEMMRIGHALGAKIETITGLAGLGDLVLTCTDDQSRNRRFGLALGKGENSQQAENNLGHVVEGKRNAELVVQLANKHKIEVPITEMVLEILQNKSTPKQAMQKLLNRETKSE